MRASTTIFLLILLAAAWAAWKWIAAADATRPPPLGKPLVSFAAGEVSEIQLRRTEASANLNPVNGVWHFTSPLFDRVDPNAALAIYLGLNGLVLHEIIPEREWRGADRQIEEFGLGRKAVRARLLTGEKSTMHDFRIGDVAPWLKDGEPTMYFQWKNGPVPDDILVVGGNLRALLDRPFDALRARQALYLPRPPLAISLSLGQESLDLAREAKDKPWMILRPVAERANGAAVDALLKKLSELEATALLPRSPLPFSASESARLAITMAKPAKDDTGDNTIEALIQPPGPNEVDVISRWSDRRYDLRLPARALAIIKPDLKQFRSRNLGDYIFENTLELLVRHPGEAGEPVVLRLEREGWQLFLRDRWVPADPGRIQMGIDMLAACPLIGYPTDSLTDPAAYGLDQPMLQVALRGKDGATDRITFGKMSAKTYARRDDALSVYEIPEAVPGFFPTHPASWRSRQLFGFSAIDVRQIALQLAGQESLTLRYNAEENLWLAARGEKDLSADIDPAAAANLATTLERLMATRWLASGTGEALAALAKPTSTLGLAVDTLNDDGSPGPIARILLEFVPAAPGSPYFFGRFAGEPDVFLIPQSTLKDLATGLFSTGAEPP